ncbi:MAG: hypothetical protein QXE28_05120 [Desulfurococcaceae archaeon]
MYKPILVRKDTHDRLTELKYELRAKSLDQVIRFLLDNYSKGRQEVKEVKRSEEEIAKIVSELIRETCERVGEDARFLPMLIVKRYKIQDRDILEYMERVKDKEVVCLEVLRKGRFP